MDDTADEVQSQANVSKIPINSDLPFNNNANYDKLINILKNAQLKHPSKNYVCHSLI